MRSGTRPPGRFSFNVGEGGRGRPPSEGDDPTDRSTTKEVVEIRSKSMNTDDPIVEEVVRCEDLPPGSLAGRRMIVRWSDGTEGEAVRFYQDEVLSPVAHVGRQ
jgi:hypothetical protein